MKKKLFYLFSLLILSSCSGQIHNKEPSMGEDLPVISNSLHEERVDTNYNTILR